MRLRSGLAWITAGYFIATTVPALPCPVCSTPTGVEVRNGIFNEDFWRNATQILAPFPVFAASVAWIFWGGRKQRPRKA